MAEGSSHWLKSISILILCASTLTGILGFATYDALALNLPPVANAGPDQDVNVGAVVTFNASGTTDDLDSLGSLNFTWSFTYGGSARNLWGVTSGFQFSEIGSYIVTLTVIDLNGSSGTDILLVNVNGPPTANAGPDINGVAGEAVTFDGSSSNDDAGASALNYTWNGTVGGSLVTLYSMNPNYTFVSAGTYVFTLTVRDAGGLTSNDTVTVVVAPANTPPVASAGPDQTIKAGKIVIFDGTASTDDNGTAGLIYTWEFEYNGEVQRMYGPQPTFTFNQSGTYSVTLTVTDSEGLASMDTMSVTVDKTSKSFISQYWSLVIIVIAAVSLVVLLLTRRKGPPSAKEADRIIENESPRTKVVPPPDEEEL